MDPKDILRRARRIQNRIDRRQAELDRLREMRSYLSATEYDRPVVANSTGRGPVERMATDESLDRLDQTIREDIRAMSEAKLEAIGLISLLEDTRMKEILWEYYIRCAKSWDAVADSVGYTRRNCTRLHGRALQELRRMSLNVPVDP